jgi:hypothetical protein
MRRALLTTVGLLLCSAAVVALCVSIYDLGRIGTCASGGPYVSARPCPPGTALTILLIPGAVFAGLAGLALYAAGRLRERLPQSPVPLGIWMWAFLFLGIAGSLALAAWGPAASDDGEGGVTIAAITLLVVFVPMGLFPIFASISARRSSSALAAAVAQRTATTRPPKPKPKPAATPPRPRPDDVVTRLERINALRESGAVTPEEYARLKAQILGEG